jgi:hypothetical protein
MKICRRSGRGRNADANQVTTGAFTHCNYLVGTDQGSHPIYTVPIFQVLRAVCVIVDAGGGCGSWGCRRQPCGCGRGVRSAEANQVTT